MASRVVRAELYDTTPLLPAQMRRADRIVRRVPTEARSGSRAIPFTIFGREPPNSRQLIVAELFGVRDRILALRERVAQLVKQLDSQPLRWNEYDDEDGKEPDPTAQAARATGARWTQFGWNVTAT